MLNYILIAGVLLYIFIMRVFAHGKLGIVSASAIVVLGNFTLSTLVASIMLSANDASLWQLFGLVPVATVILQFIVALGVFYKLQEHEESYSAWLLWGVVGCGGIFFLTPFVVRAMFAQFG
ncbi:MAG TPA: hypothetical protein VGE13_00705 [Candidatus Saccharimonadales bacterium]